MLVLAIFYSEVLYVLKPQWAFWEREREEVLKMNRSVTIRDWSHTFGGRGKS